MLSESDQSTPCISGGRSAPNNARGRSASMPNGPCCSSKQAGGITLQEARQEQRIGPHRKADQHAGHGAAGGSLAPEQAAEEGRRQLGKRCERQQADRRQLRIAERAIVEIRHHHDGEDRKAPDPEQEVAEILAAVARRGAALQHQRQDDVVGDHDGERDAFHDHHRGRGRQAADEDGNAEQRGIRLDRQRQYVHVAVHGAERKGDEAGERDRNHEQVDGDQIERKQPARAADLLGAGVLDHADVKLPRQQHDRAERQQRHGEEIADRRRIVDRAHRLRGLHRAFDQLDRREHPEGDEGAGGEKGHQLDDGFGGDRQHQAVLVLGGVGLAGAEQHRECRHRQRHDQRDVADDRDRGEQLVLAQDRLQRGRHRLELQRDVRHRTDDRDHSHRGGDRLALAVARRDEVGDRGDVLRLGELDHAPEQRRAKPDHQDRADIDREKIEAGAGGETDRAEEGPGGAVDRQRQRIDQHAGAAALARRQPVAIAGDAEQQADIGERGGDHAPVVQHRCLSPSPIGRALGAMAGRGEYKRFGPAAHRATGPICQGSGGVGLLGRQRFLLQRQAETVPDLQQRFGEPIDQAVVVVGRGRDP